MYAAIVSTLAAIASAGSLYLHWVKWKADRKSKSLILNIRKKPSKGLPEGWHSLSLSMRSRSDTGYTANRFRVLWPPTARTVDWWDCHVNVSGSMLFAEPERGKLIRQMPLNVQVAHAGKSQVRAFGHGPIVSPGDTTSSDIFVFSNKGSRVLVSVHVAPEDDTESHIIRRKWIRL